jgi:colanic acid/amylovoran biosynthesis glycosyltransferase
VTGPTDGHPLAAVGTGIADAADPGLPVVGHVMRAYLARTETFVYNQMASLRRHHPVPVAHHRRPSTDFPLGDGAIAEELLRPRLARVERLAYARLRVALPPATAALARFLREREARLLHFHYLTDARFLLGVRRRTRLPSIVSGYGYDVSSFPRLMRGLGGRYLRPLFRDLDAFLAMSEDMRRDLLALGCPDEKIIVHYYGSDTSRFRVPERRYERDGPLTILCCGRLHEAKGQHLVLQALRRIERRGSADFRVVIVGDGPLRAELERLVAEYGWRERVTFCGHVPYTSETLVREFREADVFPHPSLTLHGLKEGIPGTIVEAMAAGLPVVATQHAGIPAVIESGRHGLLVPERDVESLAEALQALVDDAGLRERLGRAAAARAQQELSLKTRTVELERIYDRFA